jgi:hypothetical protein
MGVFIKTDRQCNKAFVALFNKLTFCWVSTRVGLKNQVGQGDFTSAAEACDDADLTQRANLALASTCLLRKLQLVADCAA